MSKLHVTEKTSSKVIHFNRKKVRKKKASAAKHCGETLNLKDITLKISRCYHTRMYPSFSKIQKKISQTLTVCILHKYMVHCSTSL